LLNILNTNTNSLPIEIYLTKANSVPFLANNKTNTSVGNITQVLEKLFAI